jgi:hypothetical protein
MAGDKDAVVPAEVKEEVKRSFFDKLNDWGCKSFILSSHLQNHPQFGATPANRH